MQGSRVAEVLARYTDTWMSVPGVVGTAEGECGGHPCILVLVDRRTPAIARAIPSTQEGIPVEIREIGKIRAIESADD
jgi:hypothetical protein